MNRARKENDAVNSEIRDKITLPEYRFNGLLDILEKEVKRDARAADSHDAVDTAITRLFDEFRENITIIIEKDL